MACSRGGWSPQANGAEDAGCLQNNHLSKHKKEQKNQTKNEKEKNDCRLVQFKIVTLKNLSFLID